MLDVSNILSVSIFWKLFKIPLFVKLFHLVLMLNLSRINNCYNGFIICGKKKDFWQILKKQLKMKMMATSVRMRSNKKIWRPIVNVMQSHFLVLVICFSPIVCTEATELFLDLPSHCESCVILASELELRSARVYKFTEASAIEALEDICSELAKYKVHKDKEGLARFQREESQTMTTLKELKERGVKVELGMPYEMWDSQSAEIVELRQHCELIIGQFDDDLIAWLLGIRRDSLQNFLCRHRFLIGKDQSCLSPPIFDEL